LELHFYPSFSGVPKGIQAVKSPKRGKSYLSLITVVGTFEDFQQLKCGVGQLFCLIALNYVNFFGT